MRISNLILFFFIKTWKKSSRRFLQKIFCKCANKIRTVFEVIAPWLARIQLMLSSYIYRTITVQAVMLILHLAVAMRLIMLKNWVATKRLVLSQKCTWEFTFLFHENVTNIQNYATAEVKSFKNFFCNTISPKPLASKRYDNTSRMRPQYTSSITCRVGWFRDD